MISQPHLASLTCYDLICVDECAFVDSALLFLFRLVQPMSVYLLYSI